MSRVEVVAALGADLGESPVWDVDAQVVHQVDILGKCIHQIDPATGAVDTIAVDGVPGAIALRESGGYVAALDLGFAFVSFAGDIQRIAEVDVGDRMNDAKCDPCGRFVGGTLDAGEEVGGARLYRLDADGSVVTLVDDVALSNGLGWSPSDTTMYYADTTTERVDCFDYDPDSGSVHGRRPFVDLGEVPGGRPDGLCVDKEGGVWVAVAGAGMVRRYSPDGQLDTEIAFPTTHVTSVAFGGKDLDQLYVTSSKELERNDHPLAGALFVVPQPGTRGVPPVRFAG